MTRLPMYFFSSDHHFGHERIIELCNRPFKDRAHQTEQLIKRWNAAVGPDDHVFVLGDFAHRATEGEARAAFDALNGTKSLVVGNHDGDAVKALPWQSHDPKAPELAVTEMLRFSHEAQEYFMCHYAWRTWPNDNKGTIHLFGHSHGALPDLGRSCDVGVDRWDFTPVSTHQLMARFQSVPPHA
ncbi:metallophosphoesterase [Pseudovibrio sp. SPO723]|uniref:metallophosphoesterase n=1 Tax=Nesiotobacter zosterae TaxID=392721 RepID=UPI0029C4C49B|nr:metallophosphoesterase [Pseudovibrio sp. SPO723]MDX5593331.1 metallophosphoesterase [Pseudovibrio sp. SPO723]